MSDENLPPGVTAQDVSDAADPRPHCVWCGRAFESSDEDQEYCPRCAAKADAEDPPV